MKAKSLLAGLLLLLILLTGCGQAKIKEAHLRLDPTPAVSDRVVYIHDVKLEKVYEHLNLFYLDAEELAQVLGGTVEIDKGMEDHRAVLTVGGKRYPFTTFSAPQEGTTIYCYKGSLYDGEKFYCPIESLEDYFGLKGSQDYTLGNVYHYGDEPIAAKMPAGVKVPVLMYHAVSDDTWGIDSLFLSPAKMEEQLKWLTENEYTPIWFEDLVHVDQIQNPVILTFDDGYDDNYTQLFPLLKKYNVKATVFMVTGSIGAKNYLTEAQIKEMASSGLVSFQSHTVTHQELPELSKEELQTELKQSKETLFKLTGKRPIALCYPTGEQNKGVREFVGKEYQFGLLMSGDTWVTGEDALLIHRKYISRSITMNQFKKMLK